MVEQGHGVINTRGKIMKISVFTMVLSAALLMVSAKSWAFGESIDLYSSATPVSCETYLQVNLNDSQGTELKVTIQENEDFSLCPFGRAPHIGLQKGFIFKSVGNGDLKEYYAKVGKDTHYIFGSQPTPEGKVYTLKLFTSKGMVKYTSR